MNKQLKRYLTITLGTCISGVALNAFFLPHHLLSGGITGLGMILYYLFGWQVSLTNILFNIPLFILAYKLMSRNYFISGIYGTLVLSFFLQLFAPLQQLTQVHDPMLSCIAGGVLHGIGLGTLYRVGGSTGGSDIIGAQHRHHRFPDQHRTADGRRLFLRTGTGPVHPHRLLHRV